MDTVRLNPRQRHGPDVFRLWFTPSGRRLLVLTGHPGGANRLWTWDVAGRQPLGRRKVVTDAEHDNCFPWPAFDPNMRYRVFDGHATDRRTGKRIKLEYATLSADVVPSPDGRVAFAIGDPSLIDRYDLTRDFNGKSWTVRYDKAWAIPQAEGV
jgi:hypothetical protein